MSALASALLMVLTVSAAACRPESHGQGQQVLVPPDALVRGVRAEPGSNPRVEVPADQKLPVTLRVDSRFGTRVEVPADHEPRLLRVELRTRVELPAEEELPRAMRRRAQAMP